MPKALNLDGKRFGRLTTLERDGSRAGKSYWKCKCDCGKITSARAGDLVQGKTRSCGCIQKDAAAKSLSTHGMSWMKEHRIWKGMRDRCNNKRNPNFDRYGGRQISICERWNSFPLFLKDMGPRPSSKHTIERLDNNGDYEPANCIWATRAQQAINTRRTIKVIINGKQTSVRQACKILGRPYDTITARLRRGWSFVRAISTPIKTPTMRLENME